MFIVLDAIDGAGKGHQRIEISDRLKKEFGLVVKSEEFPVHNAFYEVVIHLALQEEATMNGPSWILSFLLDKTLQAPKIEKYVGKNDNLYLADGYFTTTIAYQSLLMKQIKLGKLLQYSEEFAIPKPDFAIYLDVDPEIALARKEKEEGHEEGLDMFEKSLGKQKQLREIFRRMVREQIYCEWEEVDGNGKPEEVTDSIIDVFRKRKII